MIVFPEALKFSSAFKLTAERWWLTAAPFVNVDRFPPRWYTATKAKDDIIAIWVVLIQFCNTWIQMSDSPAWIFGPGQKGHIARRPRWRQTAHAVFLWRIVPFSHFRGERDFYLHWLLPESWDFPRKEAPYGKRPLPIQCGQPRFPAVPKSQKGNEEKDSYELWALSFEALHFDI